jgi:hypothetical protein
MKGVYKMVGDPTCFQRNCCQSYPCEHKYYPCEYPYPGVTYIPSPPPFFPFFVNPYVPYFNPYDTPHRFTCEPYTTIG